MIPTRSLLWNACFVDVRNVKKIQFPGRQLHLLFSVWSGMDGEQIGEQGECQHVALLSEGLCESTTLLRDLHLRAFKSER